MNFMTDGSETQDLFKNYSAMSYNLEIYDNPNALIFLQLYDRDLWLENCKILIFSYDNNSTRFKQRSLVLTLCCVEINFDI